MSRQRLLLDLYHAMLAELGPSSWWPGETPFEIAIGAILTQNTAWSNVEKAIANLRARNLLAPRALAEVGEEELTELIRPSGSFRVKAGRVRNFLRFLDWRCGMDMARLAREDLDELRPALLQVSGVGPETADSILLYALDKPSFVVDAYTRRILSRHGMVAENVGYADLRGYFMDVLKPDVRLFNEFHALIVRTGKTWCAKKAGRCAQCPLARFL